VLLQRRNLIMLKAHMNTHSRHKSILLHFVTSLLSISVLSPHLQADRWIKYKSPYFYSANCVTVGSTTITDTYLLTYSLTSLLLTYLLAYLSTYFTYLLAYLSTYFTYLLAYLSTYFTYLLTYDSWVSSFSMIRQVTPLSEASVTVVRRHKYLLRTARQSEHLHTLRNICIMKTPESNWPSRSEDRLSVL